ncbi:tetratricopeptide repeat protein [Lacinutrix sp. 5H-3-7-4]|uniref:tetratricopeptide repeat protein n=1 Tax=Lacinutrix sp. (strain 5H-3-7-4) TaxID=983544 RepID=UPI00020A3482|nr:tetratricopeptide repeat protein [Lacinutrix sp. 5H-3-7-4]AEH01382.1 hypothetical protein Lacal_1534 [Lacinutrix sp. 5H-3-7-4]
MNKIEFTSILQKPQAISKDQTSALQDIVKTFPYFQSARAMHLKGLKNSGSFQYNQALKKTAAYTTDRSILFDFITSENFTQNEISQQIKQNTANINAIDVVSEDISVNKSQSIDNALKEHIDSTTNILDPELFQPKVQKDKIAHIEASVKTFTTESNNKISKENKSPETILEIGKPLEFNKTETHSFGEWLSLTKFNPINRNTEIKKTQASKNKPIDNQLENSLSRAKKFELIEKFIEKSPKLEAKKTKSSNHNIAKAQMIKPEALMTETLARIYLEQKNYKKAIQSYNILILKYPEKSGFFADQIKAIKQLQEQNHKE